MGLERAVSGSSSISAVARGPSGIGLSRAPALGVRSPNIPSISSPSKSFESTISRLTSLPSYKGSVPRVINKFSQNIPSRIVPEQRVQTPSLPDIFKMPHHQLIPDRLSLDQRAYGISRFTQKVISFPKPEASTKFIESFKVSQLKLPEKPQIKLELPPKQLLIKPEIKLNSQILTNKAFSKIEKTPFPKLKIQPLQTEIAIPKAEIIKTLEQNLVQKITPKIATETLKQTQLKQDQIKIEQIQSFLAKKIIQPEVKKAIKPEILPQTKPSLAVNITTERAQKLDQVKTQTEQVLKQNNKPELQIKIDNLTKTLVKQKTELKTATLPVSKEKNPESETQKKLEDKKVKTQLKEEEKIEELVKELQQKKIEQKKLYIERDDPALAERINSATAVIELLFALKRDRKDQPKVSGQEIVDNLPTIVEPVEEKSEVVKSLPKNDGSRVLAYQELESKTFSSLTQALETAKAIFRRHIPVRIREKVTTKGASKEDLKKVLQGGNYLNFPGSDVAKIIYSSTESDGFGTLVSP